jgi:hypothetical protein
MFSDSGYGSKPSEYSKQTLHMRHADLVAVHEESSLNNRVGSTDLENYARTGLYAAGTVYSASLTSTLPAPKQDGYINDIAQMMFKVLGNIDFYALSAEDLSSMLPDWLKTFAIKVGHLANSQMERDVAFLVHKNRS